MGAQRLQGRIQGYRDPGPLKGFLEGAAQHQGQIRHEQASPDALRGLAVELSGMDGRTGG